MNSGDTIGKYRLVRRLGAGGMGEVWLATAIGHSGFSKTVVLKTLLPELARDPLFIDILANEARICAKLSHPNLIEVFDFSEHDGTYLLAMEHVTGHPLHHIMRAARGRNWALPPWFTMRIAWECCRALHYAHEHGVVHCDLSPSNVMVTFTGVTKVLDFGVAHAVSRGPRCDRLKGKFAYIAPERIKSLATDQRTDIYSLGVMLYLIVTSQLPFTATSDAELLKKIVSTRPQRPSELAPVDSRLERLILRAMQPDPARRYQNMDEVLAELEPCLEGQLGAYGQQDVANLVGRLFPPPSPEPVRVRTATPPGVEIGEDDVTRQPGGDDAFPAAIAQELRSVDIDLDFESVVSRAETPPPIPGKVVARIARGSSSSPPLPRPEPPAPYEPLSTVQSLFGERPSSIAVGPSRIFARPDPIAPPERGSEQEEAAEPPVVSRTITPGGFGAYSGTRLPNAPAWPWTASRTKPD
ncbi:MAG: serine/threonine-protein kinase [Kofleriaceae bacterium]|nr:serine/threonine-protein kinase [Kofleriaceae bacterium]